MKSVLCKKSQALSYFDSLTEFAEHSQGCSVDDAGRGCTCGLDALSTEAMLTFSVDTKVEFQRTTGTSHFATGRPLCPKCGDSIGVHGGCSCTSAWKPTVDSDNKQAGGDTQGTVDPALNEAPRTCPECSGKVEVCESVMGFTTEPAMYWCQCGWQRIA